MIESIKEIPMLLKRNKIKVTRPRICILEYLILNRVHPTAENIFIKVKEKLPDISRATIYNNLNFFVDNHIVKRYRLYNDVDIYDLDISHHSHFICEKCHQIYDLEFNVDIPRETEGHQVKDLIIKFLGVCKNCSGGKAR